MSDNDQDLLARCAAIGTSTWADAMDTLGIAGVVQGIERRGGQGRIAGFAVTAPDTELSQRGRDPGHLRCEC